MIKAKTQTDVLELEDESRSGVKSWIRASSSFAPNAAA
jgi:hypothetical protein